MARGIVTRRGRWYEITSFRLGLRTDDDYLTADVRSARLLQNARTRTGRIVKRNGSRYYSPSLASDWAGRCNGLHQWYPATRVEENLVYAAVGADIVRLPWDSTSVDPPTRVQQMTFADGTSFGIGAGRQTTFVDYNDYCFAFNGTSAATLRLDAPDSMYRFQLPKASNPTIVTAGSGGSIAAGTYGYRIRYVRERDERVREYWGPMSDLVSVKTIGASSANTLTLPTTDLPADATHIYIYRTLADLDTLYYLGRVSVGTNEYVDTMLSPSTEIDDDTLHIDNIYYATVDDGSLFVVFKDATTGGWYWANSVDGRPQEFGLYNNGEIAEGSGDVTGAHAFGGAVYVFREKGIIVYRKNSALTYDRETYLPGWGNISPWACRVIRDGRNNFISFFDDAEGPCIVTAAGIETLKRKRYSDCVKYIDDASERDSAYRAYVSVGYKRGYIYWGYTPVGSTYNTKVLVYDTATEAWYGPDTGYPIGPTFTRLTNRGVFGNGELLAASDADDVRIIEVDAPYSRDCGSNIVLHVQGMALGSDALAAELEFQQIALIAKLTSVFRFDVNVNDGEYTGSYYIAPASGRYYYDSPSSVFDVSTFDTFVQSLMDSSYFDASDVTFDTAKDRPYQIELDSASAQGAFCTLSLYDANSYAFEIARLRVLAVNRGERT